MGGFFRRNVSGIREKDGVKNLPEMNFRLAIPPRVRYSTEKEMIHLLSFNVFGWDCGTEYAEKCQTVDRRTYRNGRQCTSSKIYGKRIFQFPAEKSFGAGSSRCFRRGNFRAEGTPGTGDSRRRESRRNFGKPRIHGGIPAGESADSEQCDLLRMETRREETLFSCEQLHLSAGCGTAVPGGVPAGWSAGNDQ